MDLTAVSFFLSIYSNVCPLILVTFPTYADDLKMRYSLKYSLVFGMISALAALMIISLGLKDEWANLWVFSGSASAIVAFTLSYFFIEKKQPCTNTRIVLVGTSIALLSHWLCWFEFLLFNMYTELDPTTSPHNPIDALGGAFGLTFFSLMFFGWTSIPISIYLGFKFKK